MELAHARRDGEPVASANKQGLDQEGVAMRLMFAGPGIGTDAGGWYIGRDGKIHRVPGWNPEAVLELGSMVDVIRGIGQLKNHAIAEAALQSGIVEAAFKEVGGHMKEGGILVLR